MNKDKYKLSSFIILILIISAISLVIGNLYTHELNRGRNLKQFSYDKISSTVRNSLYGGNYDSEYHFKYAVKSYKLKYYYPNGDVVEDSEIIKKFEQKKSLEDKGLNPKDYMYEEDLNIPYIKGEFGTFYISNDIVEPEFEPLQLDTKGKDFFISGTFDGKKVQFDKISRSKRFDNSNYSFLIDKFKKEILEYYNNYLMDKNIKNLKFAYYGNLDDPVFKNIEIDSMIDNIYISGGTSVFTSLVLSFVVGLILNINKIKNSDKLRAIFSIPIEIVGILFFMLFFLGIGTTSLYFIYNSLEIYYLLFFIGCFLVTLTGLHLTINLKSVFSKNSGNLLLENSIICRIFRKIIGEMSDLNTEKFNNYKIKFTIIFSVIILVVLFLLLIMQTNPLALAIILIIGASLYFVLISNINEVARINKESNKIVAGDYKNKIENNNGIYSGIIENFNNISSNLDIAVEDALKSERLKTELITNVSHDLKTPLTSIINYSDLLNKEGNSQEEIKEYSKIINEKSNKLKVLIEDLFEVSKASSNNIELQRENLDFKSLIAQSIGEWEDKISEKNIEIISKLPEEKVILNIDGQKMSRVLDNLFSNISKYALENSRVYLELENNNEVKLTIKNISKYPLDITPDELIERFTRGEKSRTTSGSGLGLSIASSFVKAHGASFNIDIDGDLFKITIIF
ncbi:sensor histidine kinase [Peptoniphilus sp. MSJ-1]|uniref:histidine kinase n=1 Tax=Peptoniphilus ovalis TaxID=2841503 RepID=A0ABS6FFQ7_9FIRM|nr:histidine kinase dimerization/phospho-acceptor domain-containing protein [Peptoniphilus ovalis]MBU5668990.1 sensor histidine kinase [Peptoniphilus ovalis]